MSARLDSASSSHADPPSETAASVATQKSKDICVICLEEPHERAVAVPCNHCSFDFLCLASWVQDHATCPLCKCALTAIEYDWRSPDDFKTYIIAQPTPAFRSWPRRPLRGYRHRGFGRRTFDARPPQTADEEVQARESALERRRQVYRQRLFSLHIGSNRISRFRDFTPADFLRSPELQSRARTWVRREFQVFDFLNAPGGEANAEFVLSYVIAILKVVDIKSSTGLAEEKLAEFLGRDDARLFLHELESWLRSPFSRLEDWDRSVQYRDVDLRGKAFDEFNDRRFDGGSPAEGSSRDGERSREMLRRYEPG